MNHNLTDSPENDRMYLEKVEEAILKQFEFEANVNKICEEIKLKFSECCGIAPFPNGNTFASMQLLTVDNKIIETVAGQFGENIKNKGWIGISRHHVDRKHKDIRDMHANLVAPILLKEREQAPIKICIVSGWQKSFDRWIYNHYEHERYVRVFIPIILIKDKNGKIVSDDWSMDWSMETVQEPELDTLLESNKAIGFSQQLELKIPKRYSDYEINVIGTIGVGYFHDSTQEESSVCIPEALIKKISISGTLELAKLIARKSIEIYEHTLSNVFDTITEQIREKVGAVSTSLHYLKDNLNTNNYAEYYIRSSSGEMSTMFLNECPIHKDGLGQQAIQEKKTKFLPGDDLKEKNKKVYENKISVMVASPLIINSDDLKNEDSENHGILYVHFRDEQDFNKGKEDVWIDLFAKKAIFAIRTAMNYVNIRNDNRMLEAFEGVSHLLLQPSITEELHNYIAGMTKNILAADVVSIYPIIKNDKEKEDVEFSRPFVAGALLEEREFKQPGRYSGTRLLLESDAELHFAPVSKNDGIMNSTLKRETNVGKFVEREDISSSIGIKIRIDDEDVGVMFIHYRRSINEPTTKESKLIKLIASWAAISIKNKRDYNQRLPFRISKENYNLLSSSSFLDNFSNVTSGHKSRVHKSFVLSVDIRKSTELMLKAADKTMYVEFMLRLEKELRKILQDNLGIVDRFTGDGMLAYFPNFYSGDDAGLYCVRASHRCHQMFKDVLKSYKDTFQILPKDIGFGIGIDYGDISMYRGKETNEELIVIGSPVVYACRLSSVKANHTAVNIQAKKEIENLLRTSEQNNLKDILDFKDASINIKHDEEIDIYYLRLAHENFTIRKPNFKKYN